MSRLPVIVGFGGVNSAGRSSFHHGYRRLIYDTLPIQEKQDVLSGLATFMGLASYKDNSYYESNGNPISLSDLCSKYESYILEHTLVRKMETNLFDAEHSLWNSKIKGDIAENKPVTFTMNKKRLPEVIPKNWVISEDTESSSKVHVTISGEFEFLVESTRRLASLAAGQLPTGFDPAILYKSAHQPRTLQMSIWGASDALHSVGIDWNVLKNYVRPEEIGVYASSAMGQLDDCSTRGYMTSAVTGTRVSSKQIALSLAEMPGDFINAYVLGNVGTTSCNIGACATFLYNLKAAVADIQAGRCRVAIVGNVDAPLIAEVMDAYTVMGALADDAGLLALDKDKGLTTPDYRRACRPFSDNVGFVMSEGAQFFVIVDDEIALKTGATMYGSVGGIFVNADGFKKSISSPGFGNYITIARALGLARSIVGDAAIKKSHIHAHGSGTPQNRVTESHIMNEMAKTFGIEKWTVAAVKAYVGHTLSAASADQLATILGTWKYGIIPGIKTIDHVAHDVYQSNLHISPNHTEIDPKSVDIAFMNAKGFGGNNASGFAISPTKTRQMLEKKHGVSAFIEYEKKNSVIAEKAAAYNDSTSKGNLKVMYNFGEGMLEEKDLNLTKEYMKIPGFENTVSLQFENPYSDM